MKVLVCGASGLIGGNMVNYLKQHGKTVIGVDIADPKYGQEKVADKFLKLDLRDFANWSRLALLGPFAEVYQFAADMGGAGFVFTGEHDADIMQNSARINLNCAETFRKDNRVKVFYSSSACVYPKESLCRPGRTQFKETDAYPAMPDNDYGWEKLFSERMYLAYARNCGLDVRMARFHNIFGPNGTWTGGREKFPAAICRKVAEAEDGGEIELWGDGTALRSYLYIDDCMEAIARLMKGPKPEINPINIGSDFSISVDEMAKMVMGIAGKKLTIKHIPGPVGVAARNSDNTNMEKVLGWKPAQPLHEGMTKLYRWIEAQI
jgi:nucleoside-diphosphate-sugar epimerase